MPTGRPAENMYDAIKWVINTKASSGCHNATPRGYPCANIIFAASSQCVLCAADLWLRRYIHRRKHKCNPGAELKHTPDQCNYLRLRRPSFMLSHFIAALCMHMKCLCCINLWLEAFLDCFQLPVSVIFHGLRLAKCNNSLTFTLSQINSHIHYISSITLIKNSQFSSNFTTIIGKIINFVTLSTEG